MNEIDDILRGIRQKDPRAIGRAISMVEEGDQRAGEILQILDEEKVQTATIIGITGSPGVGKSTLVDQLISYYRRQGLRIGIVAIDPSSPVSGGAFLGDRIRMMRHTIDQDVLIRSMATRGRLGGLCAAAGAAARIMASSGCNPVIVETVGIGQAEVDVISLADITVLVFAPGLGDDIQAMKAGLIEMADILVVNKADCPGADALVMEIESVIQGRNCPVCRTIALETAGIEELAAVIRDMDQKKRQNGQFAQNRQKARESEVLDWAVEMMLIKLKDRLQSQSRQIKGDPRMVARKLIEEIGVS
ncbi:MAG TPA: methylmalonyl Co-A mutase-associated GTPase MeaB [Geobacteraceae bacterium]|nr:methylmalonyl Co-A mutase-associated GTPase MeaB [Geobacteraceae bacterium]